MRINIMKTFFPDFMRVIGYQRSSDMTKENATTLV